MYYRVYPLHGYVNIMGALHVASNPLDIFARSEIPVRLYARPFEYPQRMTVH